MSHQARKLQNPLKTLKVLQFYRFKTVKDRIICRQRRNVKNFCSLLYDRHMNSRQVPDTWVAVFSVIDRCTEGCPHCGFRPSAAGGPF